MSGLPRRAWLTNHPDSTLRSGSCCLLRKRTLGRYCFPTPLCAAAGGGEGAGPVERE